MRDLLGRLAGILMPAAMVLVLTTSLSAQQESSSTNPPTGDPNNPPDSEVQSDSSSYSSSAEQKTVDSGSAQLPGAPVFRKIGQAAALARVPRYVHVGSVYVADAQVYQLFDQIKPPDGSPIQNNQVTLMRGLLVYDRPLRRSRLALQYEPRLTVLNGNVLSDYLNQRVQFSSYYALSRKWTMSFHDQFAYLGTRSLFIDSYFGADAGTGFVQKNDFLEGPSKLITNGTELRFDYIHSLRTQISISSTYNYAFFANQGNSSTSTDPFNNTGRRFTNTLEYSRVLDGKSSVGLHYQTEWAQFTGRLRDILYQSFGGSYSRQLSPTWRMYVSMGVARPILYTGSTAQWTLVGDVNAVRSFRRSLLALGYSRDYTFPGFISSAYHDRGDVSYFLRLTHRFRVGTGGGYFREFASPRTTTISGQYVTAQAAYELAPGLSWVVTAVSRRQAGDGLQVSSGARRAILFGLQWSPPGRYEKPR